MNRDNENNTNFSSALAGKNGRIEWLDILRALAMYLVVIAHATENNSPEYYRMYIYSFHMPLFFMISGGAYYLQMKSKDWKFGTVVKNKARGLLWPYLTLNFIAFFIWVLNFKILSYSKSTLPDKIHATLYSNEEFLAAPSNATWFLTTLFLTILVFYLLKKWSGTDEKYLILAVGVLAAIGYACSVYKNTRPLPWHIDTVPVALVMFLIGYLFIKYLNRIEVYIGGTGRQIPIFLICIAAGFCFARLNGPVSMAGNNYGSFILFMGSSVSFSFAFMLLSVWLPKFRILKFIGRNTIVYLAFHAPIFRFFEVFSERSRNVFEQHPTIIATLVFIVLIPVAYVFERYLGFLLGRKKRAAK